jgi:hypothetical protein
MVTLLADASARFGSATAPFAVPSMNSASRADAVVRVAAVLASFIGHKAEFAAAAAERRTASVARRDAAAVAAALMRAV